MKPLILVSAAILIKKKHILLSQRKKSDKHSSLWEFPGGKSKKNEIPEKTIERELFEELGVTVDLSDIIPWRFVSYSYEEFHLLMTLFTCKKWKGSVFGKEKQNIRWCNKLDIKSYSFLPADKKLINRLDEFLN